MAGLVAATAVLGGCSEKQEANDSLPSTTATETTPELPTLGPEDLPMPDEARTQDAAGAEAFVRYYIELINRAADRVDAAPLRQLSDQCDDCDRITTNVELGAKAGYRYEGGEISVTDVAAPLLQGDMAEIAIRVDQATLTVLDSANARVEQQSSDALVGLDGSVALVWDPALTTWLMTYMGFGPA